MTSHPYVKEHRMDKVTNAVSNISAREHVSCQVSPSPHSSVALPSSPGHLQGSSELMLIDGHFEDSSAEN
jgi:hypothetical protein